MAAIVKITALPTDQVRSCGATACGNGAASLVSVVDAPRYGGATGSNGERIATPVLVVPSCDDHTAEVRRILAAEFSR